jgi:predicted ATPase
LKLKQTNISVNARKRHIFSIVNTITLACYRQSSPYLPLIACAMVRYSLSNGVLEESATAFVVYGFFLVYLKNDFDEARRWAEIAEKILDPQSSFTPCEWNLDLKCLCA